MSLLNLVVQPEFACVITDCGWFDLAAGTVSRFGPKWCALPEINLVMATAGSFAFAHALHTGIVRCGRPSQDEFVQMLPSLIRAAHEKSASDTEEHLVLGGHSVSRGAFGAVWTSADGYRLQPTHIVLGPTLPDADFERACDLARDFDAFDPYSDLLPTIDQQRRYNFGSPEEPRFMIAGEIHVTAVSRDGISTATIREYPAQIGERVSI